MILEGRSETLCTCIIGVTELHRQEFSYSAGVSELCNITPPKRILEHPIFYSVV